MMRNRKAARVNRVVISAIWYGVGVKANKRKRETQRNGWAVY